MSEMDLLKRIEALESKVAELESTIETLKNIGKSERMAEYIDKKKRANSMIELIQHISGESISDTTELDNEILQMEHSREELEQIISQEYNRLEEAVDGFNIDETKFEYTEIDSGVIITGYCGFDEKKIVFPTQINQKPLIEIGEKSFENYPCETVIISDSVTKVGASAFAGCTQLKEIHIGKKVETLGSSCFKNTGIKKIEIPGNVKTIDCSCFDGCTMLQDVILHEGIQRINSNAFRNTAITKIVLPESLSSIASEVFIKNSNLFYKVNKYYTISIAFLGIDTEYNKDSCSPCGFVDDVNYLKIWGGYINIYCKTGSKIQKVARALGYNVRPLSEFQFD